MTTTTVFRTIQVVLAPVVMITSCGILINGILVRYGAISDRLRTMARERLDLVWGSAGQVAADARDASRYVQEHLTEIDHQLPLLVRRHKILRNSLQALYMKWRSESVCPGVWCKVKGGAGTPAGSGTR